MKIIEQPIGLSDYREYLRTHQYALKRGISIFGLDSITFQQGISIIMIHQHALQWDIRFFGHKYALQQGISISYQYALGVYAFVPSDTYVCPSTRFVYDGLLEKKVISFFWLMYALQRGIFIIFGQICMPFSKVLVYLYSSVYPLIRYYNLWTHMYARQQVVSISSLLLTYDY